MKKLLSFMLLFLLIWNNVFALEKSDENKRTDFLYENWFYYADWYFFVSEDITQLNKSFDDFIESIDYSLSDNDKIVVEKIIKVVEKRIKKNDWIDYIEKLINQISTAINALANKKNDKYNKKLVLLLTINKELNYLYADKVLNTNINDFYNNILSISLLTNLAYQDLCIDVEDELDSYFKLISPEDYKKIYWKEFSLIDFLQDKSNKCLKIISDYKKQYIYDSMSSDSFYVINYDLETSYKKELSNNLWDYYCSETTTYKKCFWISDWVINNITTYYY